MKKQFVTLGLVAGLSLLSACGGGSKKARPKVDTVPATLETMAQNLKVLSSMDPLGREVKPHLAPVRVDGVLVEAGYTGDEKRAVICIEKQKAELEDAINSSDEIKAKMVQKVEKKEVEKIQILALDFSLEEVEKAGEGRLAQPGISPINKETPNHLVIQTTSIEGEDCRLVSSEKISDYLNGVEEVVEEEETEEEVVITEDVDEEVETTEDEVVEVEEEEVVTEGEDQQEDGEAIDMPLDTDSFLENLGKVIEQI